MLAERLFFHYPNLKRPFVLMVKPFGICVFSSLSSVGCTSDFPVSRRGALGRLLLDGCNTLYGVTVDV